MLDLGFFRVIQSLQCKSAPKNVQELFNAALTAYNAFIPRKLNDNFLTVMKFIECTMLKSGNNNYKQPHMKKIHFRNIGLPIIEVICDTFGYNLSTNIVNEP